MIFTVLFIFSFGLAVFIFIISFWKLLGLVDPGREERLAGIAQMQLDTEERIRREHLGHDCRTKGHISYHSGLRAWNGEHETRCGICGDHLGRTGSLS